MYRVSGSLDFFIFHDHVFLILMPEMFQFYKKAFLFLQQETRCRCRQDESIEEAQGSLEQRTGQADQHAALP